MDTCLHINTICNQHHISCNFNVFLKGTNQNIIKDMTEEFEIAGTWWTSPTNSFSGYSLPRSTEISLDVTNFGWQNVDNKINDQSDDYNMNLHTSQISWNQSIM